LEKLLDILDRENIKATFFCLGVIARDYPDVIKKIASRGHEIGSHSDKHIHLEKLGPQLFEEDLKMSISSLENLIGEKVTSYRAPAFSVNYETKWAFEILKRNGIKYDCSVFPANRADGGYSDFKNSDPVMIKTINDSLLEFPVSMSKILGSKIPFSGGGYFRLLPYSVIKKMMKNSEYVMSYFHIRDFDVKQKEVISLRYFKSYYGIKSMLPKLEQLLIDFRFITVKNAAEILQNSSLKEIIVS
jgi:polysaccharide deacetylase family protein (PEP-CTERM system associated)